MIRMRPTGKFPHRTSPVATAAAGLHHLLPLVVGSAATKISGHKHAD